WIPTQFLGVSTQFQKDPGGIPNFGVPQIQFQLDLTQLHDIPPQSQPDQSNFHRTILTPKSRFSAPISALRAEPPEVAVFPKHAVEPDEPNVLICAARKLWPPALALRWLRNGAPAPRGALETPFYPDRDFTFRKFSYLPFVPRPGDYYDCEVEHEGLAQPSRTHWGE
ncbi:RLA class II histocompatibility antigen, DP alpha-1 chain-like, partial [Passer montanus]|uniref:RLA class II histocompatibility antigen, DP alpha-1 chain-like n=1 Tax=Passer montanus TaxID=9160 RepID=UPI00195FAD84